jgi:Fe-S oxidoreductase
VAIAIIAFARETDRLVQSGEDHRSAEDTFWRAFDRTLFDGAEKTLNAAASGGKAALLFVDTFNGTFESENALAAARVLKAAGYTLHTITKQRAGAFGYEAGHYDISMQMAEVSLLPAVRKAPNAIVVADGTSCRHQIHDGAQREALHVARLLERQLAVTPP